MDKNGETLHMPALDDRTIQEMKAEDKPQVLTLEECSKERDGYGVRTEEGTGFGISEANMKGWRKRTGKKPEAGMRVHLYSGGLGSEFHGVDIDGEEVFWLTPAERVARRADWLANYDRRQREKFAEQREQLDADYEGLPPLLQDRIKQFREEEGFRAGWEGYEMFCCKEAAKFAEAARQAVEDGSYADEVDAFWALDDATRAQGGKVFEEEPKDPAERWLLWAWALNTETLDYDHDKQKKVLGSSSDHSGWTFGSACALAGWLLRPVEKVD